jgi:signal peptidase I
MTVTVAVLLALLLGTTMFVPVALGFRHYVITGESMTGAYDRGSVVYETEVPAASLRVGDVITYQPPPSAGLSGLVTHRIVSLRSGRLGEIVVQTRGDANQFEDPWRFTPTAASASRAVFAIPYVGYLIGVLDIHALRMALIGAPAVAIGLWMLLGVWREARPEMGCSRAGRAPRRRRAGDE